MTRIRTSLAASLLIVGRLMAAEPPDVQRIFAEHCLECHGPDKAKGGLRLTTREAALKELESGAHAVVPGDLQKSELIARITTDDADDKMPPKDKKPLTPAEIEAVKRWLAKGADWPMHWSYRPIQKTEPPVLADFGARIVEWEKRDPKRGSGLRSRQDLIEHWAKNPLDQFVLDGLLRTGIAPSPEADLYTLCRRLYLDLLGLVPSPDEADAFVQSAIHNRESAIESLADKLLASPHFGERWGRHWLDRARYADSDGYEKDNPRPDAWRYRDWVIGAVNRDLPFDQFTIEQLAGDLLPSATPEQKLATAFHRQTLTNTEGGADKEQFRVEATFDRTETTGSVWLGHTFTCARCHTHKYDRISHNEYYQLFAFFNDADETTGQVKISDQAVRDYEQAQAKHGTKMKALEAKLAAAKKQIATRQTPWEQDLHARLAQAPAGEPKVKTAKIVSVKGNGKTTFKALPDGSQLAAGKQAATDTYTVVVELPAERVTGLRLDMLTHASLPGTGPGRSKNGNFVLTEIAVRADTAIALHSAAADFSQNGWPVTDALDGKPETGWGVGPQFGKEHHATFYFGRALDGTKTKRITVTLDQQYAKGEHSLGRFRIAVLTGETAETIAPIAVREVLEMPAGDRSEEQRQRLGDYFAKIDPVAQQAAEHLAAASAAAPKPPTMDVRTLAGRTEPRETKVLDRGEFLAPTGTVSPAGPSILAPIKPRTDTRPDRLDLARWLVSPENPLTPRVIANQFWLHLFGEGIVRTPGDFGVRGEKPTHPELLDWLAGEFVRSGWSRKHLVRLIVTSATYRQRSDIRPELAEIDPLNLLLARQNRVRVEAEIVRDLHLAASGLLTSKVGGPSVFPPMPPEIAKLSYANNFKWTDNTDENRYRRGMYTFFKRTAPYPDLIAFDCPDANLSAMRRNISNTPLQALTTLNAQGFTEAARAMAKRLLADSDDRARIVHAFRLCLTRPPRTEEITLITTLLGKAREYYATHPDEAKTLAGGLTPTTDAAALTATARIVMNTDEFITRE